MENSLSTMIWFAFLGGLILNAMPCVFPMLAIKILSVLKTSEHSLTKVRMSGIAYTVGVILTFLVFAFAIIIIKNTGQSVGWGFQLQNPVFILGLSVLFVLIGFNFLGFFEVSLPSRMVPQSLQNKDGIIGEFWAGALVAIVATPCSAPFMASAIGYALSQSPLTILLVFTSLGLGLASPFLILTIFPKLSKYLPKPGNWMVLLKEIFAFPMFATSLWLFWVYGKQKGVDGVVWLLAAVVAISLFVWVLNTSHFKRRGKWIVAILALVMTGFSINHSLDQKIKKQTGSVEVDDRGLEWHKFSPTIVKELLDSGKKVFVDYTADWCVSCKANEKVIFSSNLVKSELIQQNFALVKADWTSEDDIITESLESFGRSGVPLYLMYGGESHNDEPLILPQLLTPDVFINHMNEIK